MMMNKSSEALYPYETVDYTSPAFQPPSD